MLSSESGRFVSVGAQLDPSRYIRANNNNNSDSYIVIIDINNATYVDVCDHVYCS